uniref:Uncharacterized protein n=1 Tax=Triticum aestivum TaxID=4565 RepID=A0A077RSB8_WHEAT|nr:unnamed protein product [Triticum aestivum]
MWDTSHISLHILESAKHTNVLLSGAAFLDGSILELWNMNNSGGAATWSRKKKACELAEGEASSSAMLLVSGRGRGRGGRGGGLEREEEARCLDP